MTGRPLLDPAGAADPARAQLRRMPVTGPVGRLPLISARMRADFGQQVGLLGRSASPVAAISEHSSAARGLEFGFYLDPLGAVHHVAEERDEIEIDRAMLRAADNGLMTLSDSQRDRMERRVELLDRWDAWQKRRLAGGPGTAPTAPGRDVEGPHRLG